MGSGEVSCGYSAGPDSGCAGGRPSEEARFPRPLSAPDGGCQPLSSRDAQVPPPHRQTRATDWSSTHPVDAAMFTRIHRHVKYRVS